MSHALSIVHVSFLSMLRLSAGDGKELMFAFLLFFISHSYRRITISTSDVSDCHIHSKLSSYRLQERPYSSKNNGKAECHQEHGEVNNIQRHHPFAPLVACFKHLTCLGGVFNITENIILSFTFLHVCTTRSAIKRA